VFLGQLVNCRNAFNACVFALVVLISLSVSINDLLARPNSTTMLIIDSSISMVGKIGKKSKISLVQKALKPALKSAKKGFDLGVMFYGHRRRGDCKDVQHLIRLGPILPKRYMEIIKGIAPRGRAPVSMAVDMAAGILKKHSQNSNIVLITDGFDACTKNLNKLSKKLRRKNADLKVHVIALRSKSSKLTSLRNLAKRTGGKYIAANTPKAINQAIKQIFLTASGGNVPLPRIGPRLLARLAEKKTAEKETGKDTAVDNTQTPNIGDGDTPAKKAEELDLKTIVSTKPLVLSANSDVAPQAASSKKKQVEAKPEETTTSIFESFFGTGKKTSEIRKTPPLPPAPKPVKEKRVQTSSETVIASAIKEPGVVEKPAIAEPEITGVNLAARLGPGGAIIENDLFWRLFEDGKTDEIRQTGAAQPLLELEPGNYKVTVQFGSVVQQQRVLIRQNKITDTVLTLNAGILVARAVKIAGGKPLDKDVSFTLLSANKSETDNRLEVSRKTANQTRFIVKPGRYRLIGKFGTTTITKDLTVRVGKSQVTDLVFNTGVLKVSSVAGKGGAVIKGATYIISEAQAGVDGKRKEISRSSNNRNTFTLPAGFYNLKVQQGAASLQRTIKIEANKTKVLILNLNAGYLKLFARPAKGASILKSKVHFTIYKDEQTLDGKREKIAQSAKNSPAFWLPAGNYFIEATYGLASAGVPVTIKANRRFEETIIVNAGALLLSSKVEGLPEKLKSQVFYTIFDAKPDLEGNYKEIFSTSQAEKIISIPPGEYLIEGRWGNTNVRTPVSAMVTAGKRSSAVVIHRAGRARFRLTAVPGGAPTGKPYWTFYDAAGVEIGRNVKPTPERIFAAGNYAVVVRYDDQEFKAGFSIKSGDRKQIDIVAKQ